MKGNGSFKPKTGVRVNNGSRIKKNGVTRIKHANYVGGSTKSDEWRKLRQRVLKMYDYRCSRCGRHISELKAGESLQVDHIKQVSRGGTDSITNLRPLCAPRCHSKNFAHEHMLRSWKTKKKRKMKS